MTKLNKATFLKQRNKLALCVMLLGALIALTSSISFFRHYSVTHEVHPVVTQHVLVGAQPSPDETPPTAACAKYKVGATLPRTIDINSINAHACIEQVGLNSKGAIAVPDNIYTAAWYVRSVKPGQEGLSVILGHVSGQYNGDGLFEHLSSLNTGNTMTITLGDGKILTYTVVSVQSVAVDQSVKALLTKSESIKSQLNLITCSGSYDKHTKEYDHRTIVVAKLT